MPDTAYANGLPEKVLQFGTGILLRGLPDYFIDQANRTGLFGGRIIMVKSTPGSAEEFLNHQCCFTTCIRGLSQGKAVEENIVNHSISRLLIAQKHWQEILEAGCRPELQIIISNTTEVGIQYEPESTELNPPSSFPAKLAAVLYHRFRKLGNSSPVLIVIPTELIPENGRELERIVQLQAAHNQLGTGFLKWLHEKVTFCNSLVDRIVTRPSDKVMASGGDTNSLTIQAEPYCLWAIEGGPKVRDILTFYAVDPGVIIAENIEYYRERKIRLLNGSHTLCVCLGFLLGLNTVYECMKDPVMSHFIDSVMMNEIAPTLILGMSGENRQFALEVLDRFRNPYTAHRLLSITLQGTAKMKMRNLPTFFRYAEKFQRAPDSMCRGFAAYLLFMKAAKREGECFFGKRGDEHYLIQDDRAGYFYGLWKSVTSQRGSLQNLVRNVAQNADLWEKDMSQLPNFVESVTDHLEKLMKDLDS